MHIFETKNNLVRRALLVATLPTICTMLTIAFVLEGVDAIVEEAKDEVPRTLEQIKQVWEKPFK